MSNLIQKVEALGEGLFRVHHADGTLEVSAQDEDDAAVRAEHALNQAEAAPPPTPAADQGAVMQALKELGARVEAIEVGQAHALSLLNQIASAAAQRGATEPSTEPPPTPPGMSGSQSG